jgi:hypothetical protein
VEFSVDGEVLVASAEGDWTVSASALYLLRSLSDDHTSENPIAELNLLFPCCGFTAWLCGTRYPLMIMGCPGGKDVEIRHESGAVQLRCQDKHHTVSFNEWGAAVLSFCDQIEEFYARSEPKVTPEEEEDRKGWAAFWSEWKVRKAHAVKGKV